MKLLYHEFDLYKIVNEKPNCFKIQRCAKLDSDCFERLVSLQPDTSRDYTFVGLFKLDNLPITTLNKTTPTDEYLVLESFDMHRNQLMIKCLHGKISYEIIPFRDVLGTKSAETMNWIIANFEINFEEYKKVKQGERTNANFAVMNQDREIQTSPNTLEMFQRVLNHWKREYKNLMWDIAESRRVDYICRVLAERGVRLRYMGDLVNEYEESYVEPLLSSTQIDNITKLKESLSFEKDPQRANWHYTQTERVLCRGTCPDILQ